MIVKLRNPYMALIPIIIKLHFIKFVNLQFHLCYMIMSFLQDTLSDISQGGIQKAWKPHI